MSRKKSGHRAESRDLVTAVRLPVVLGVAKSDAGIWA